MGRTSRKRQQKRKLVFSKLRETDDETLTQLKTWLVTQNCLSICDLIPHHFPVTGRGLKTLRDIHENEILIRMPLEILITTSTLLQSNVRILFLNTEIYSAQSVLSVFLIYEKHLRYKSRWYPYINSLPLSFTNPEFCTNHEKRLLPTCISNSLHQSHQLKNEFCLLMKSIKILNNIQKNCCPHCNVSFEKIITYEEYQWAYYVVNTRAVYLNLDKDQDNIINIRKPNNLALAPFLDLFNHDVNTAVQVSVTMDSVGNKFYHIATLRSFKKNSQVFINYGSHNNLKLYIDYGFFIPNNPLDEIYFDICDIGTCCSISNSKLDFIVSNNLHKNMGFIVDGLNYNATITLFIISTKLSKHEWSVKVYGKEFNTEELYNIYNLGLKILKLKQNQLVQSLKGMEFIKSPSQSFLISMSLVKEYINILTKSLLHLKLG